MRLTLVGHMTLRIELDGVALLTDPWFGPHNWLERRLAPRTVPPALMPADLTHAGESHLTGFLVSHNHLDHFDGAALDLARSLECVVIASRNSAKRAKKAGVQQAISLEPGEQTTLGSVTIRAVHAEHPLVGDAVGFLVIGSEVCYFSGDTRFTAVQAADLLPVSIDVALLQAACAHYPLLGDDGMSLPEAASLARRVRPRWTVPLHLHCAGKWLDRSAGLRLRQDNVAQVEAAVEHWAQSLAAEGLGVKVLRPGESWATRAGE